MYKLFNALAAMGICFGALFKIQHYPGASVLLLSGLFLRVVGYLITPKEIRSLNPLTSITNQNTFVQITNGISIALILVGVLFKIQHYPGASIMTIFGWFLLTISLVVKAFINNPPKEDIDISEFGKRD